MEAIFKDPEIHTHDRAFVHFDTLNCHTTSGVLYLFDILAVIKRYSIAAFWLQFHSFEQFILETFVLDDLLLNYHTKPVHLQLLVCIQELHDCFEKVDFSKFASDTYVKKKYSAIFPVSQRSLTVESIVSSCCSQASQLLYRRFKVEKAHLGYCWNHACASNTRSCRDLVPPNVRLCLTDNPRAQDIFKLFNCTNVFGLYTSYGFNLPPTDIYGNITSFFS